MAAAAAADELFALGEMGFEVRPVGTDTAGSLDWSAVDVLYVSSGLSAALLDPATRAAVQTWLDAGGGGVARGATGAAFNASLTCSPPPGWPAVATPTAWSPSTTRAAR